MFCSALCNQVRRREVGNQLYELQEQTVVRREGTKPVTHQQDYEESYFGEKKVFDKDYIECESDQTVYIAELFAVDRTTLSEPIKLWERGSLKHRYRTCGTFTSLLWVLDWTLSSSSSSSSSCVCVCVCLLACVCVCLRACRCVFARGTRVYECRCMCVYVCM